MVKRLIVSKNAYIHIDKIVAFNDLRNQSSTYSRKFLKALFKQFNQIKKQPLIGIHTQKENIYLLVWDNYYIYYILSTDTIQIQAVFHQKENIIR